MPVDEVQELLDRVVPTYQGRSGEWRGVVAAARSQEAPRRRSWSLPALAAVAAAGALVLFWPGGGSEDRVLERALAAVDGGPVIHLVLRSGSQEFYDLDQDRFRRIPVERELWFDPQRGLHDVERVAGRVAKDVVYPAGLPELERQFLGLAAVYRQALRDKDASVGERSSLDGRPVYWVTFNVRYPEVGIPTYEAEHRVAVDAQTFVPRAWQAEGFGRQAQGRDDRILRWETLPGGRGDFTAATTEDSDSQNQSWFGVTRVGNPSPVEARDALGQPALWLGAESAGLPLAFIRELRYETGVSGQPPSESLPGLELSYGSGEPCAITITESTAPHAMAGRGHGWTVVPPPGNLALTEDGRHGWLVREGLYVTIAARSREEVVAAAEQLAAIP
jgi:hypothetical protein